MVCKVSRERDGYFENQRDLLYVVRACSGISRNIFVNCITKSQCIDPVIGFSNLGCVGLRMG